MHSKGCIAIYIMSNVTQMAQSRLMPQGEEDSSTISLSRRLQDMVSAHMKPLKKYPYDFSGKLFY